MELYPKLQQLLSCLVQQKFKPLQVVLLVDINVDVEVSSDATRLNQTHPPKPINFSTDIYSLDTRKGWAQSGSYSLSIVLGFAWTSGIPPSRKTVTVGDGHNYRHPTSFP